MLPDRVSNPGPLTYESGALPIALRGPAWCFMWILCQAEDLHEISSIILSEKNNEKIFKAAVVIGALRVNQNSSTFHCDRGWSGGAMVLGKLPVPGRPTIWTCRVRAYYARNRCRWGLLGHFYSPLSFLASFSASGRRPDIDWNTVSKGLLSPNNQTNQSPVWHLRFQNFSYTFSHNGQKRTHDYNQNSSTSTLQRTYTW